ncbi:hypothetical protein [Paraburkholderia fungorum]|uniref:hypothetical protein n=1 Tax=Paraburkholderia fungorum TaxID=134537 RepID=UPI0038BD7C6D
MHSEPRKIALAGVLVGAVAIAAYVSQSGKQWLSSDELGLEHGSASIYHARGNMITGSVTTGPASTNANGISSAALAGDLQPAHNSSQPNDLASTPAQLDAARLVHQDDTQMGASQAPPQTRADNAQQALTTTRAEKPQQSSKSPSFAAASTAKNVHSHDRHFAARGVSHHGSGYTRSPHVPDTAVADKSASGGRASVVVAPVVASAPFSSAPAPVKVVPTVNNGPVGQPSAETVPSNPQAELTAQAVPTPPLVQPASSSGVTPKTESGALTRAQVRAEIARARSDGSLPPFGNPDPAGPGGAPSYTTAPRP